jgi:hypothetical protein
MSGAQSLRLPRCDRRRSHESGKKFSPSMTGANAVADLQGLHCGSASFDELLPESIGVCRYRLLGSGFSIDAHGDLLLLGMIARRLRWPERRSM